jgi:hypothetical protein
MYKSKLWISLIFLLLWEAANSEISASPLKKTRILKNRGNTTYFGEINITTFPSCAYTNCITSDQLSPARLGCIEPELTASCLCDQAPTPLSCSPEGPSDQDNCWPDLEDWFAGACNGSVPQVDPATMPACIQDCVFTYLRNEGCAAATRNCFCILPAAPVVKAAADCWSANCSRKKVPSFSPESWHDDICDLGNTTEYDQSGYDAYLTKVHRVRLSMAILVGMISVVLVTVGICLCSNGPDGDEVAGGVALMFAAIALVLLIIVPVYTAM